MHPTLHVPGQLVGLLLLITAGLWYFGWRRSADAKERQMAPFGGAFALAGGVLLTGVAGTITWPTYGFFMGLGCLSLAILTVAWSRRSGLMPVDQVLEMLLLAGLCGLFGARVVFLIETWGEHFADQPPAIGVGRIEEPLAAGDRLELATHGGPAFSVEFRGDEASFHALQSRLSEQGQAHDLRVEILTTQHRGDERIEVSERGLLLRTGERGPSARLKIVGGSAARKLGLIPGSYMDGVEVPLTKVFDLRGGGLTYFGSVIGVLLATAIYLRFKRISMARVMDLVAPTLPLGLFFGRLGCLSYGCCWGREAGPSALYAVQFPRWSPAWAQFAAERLPSGFDALLKDKELTPEMLQALGDVAEQTPPLHASQLYEGLAVLLIFGLVLLYRSRLQRRVGQAFLMVVLLQAPVRFVVEHFRRDHEVFFTLGGYPFTESQLVAVLMFALAVPAMIYVSRRGLLLSELPAAPSAAPAVEPAAAAETPSPVDADEPAVSSES